MSTPLGARSIRRRQRSAHPGAFLIALILVMTLGTAPASAYWGATGSASAAASTGSLSAPVDLVVPEDAAAQVPITWSPGTGGVAPTGYYVTRHGGDTPVAACASGPEALIGTTSCTDTPVAEGQYTYVVTAVYRSWTASSASSSVVNVAAPSLLGAAGDYSVLAATALVNVGTSTMSGDVGVSPGTAITGITPGMVGGGIHAGDSSAAAAHADLIDAYAELSVLDAEELVGDLGGRTLKAGVYHLTAAMAVTGTLTLDADGDPDAVFILQTDAAFNTAAGSIVELVDGALASNVFWVADGAAGTGANSFLAGTIVAYGAITLGASTQLIGRALSLDAVTLGAVTIRFTYALPPTITIAGGAMSVTKDTTPAIIGTSSASAGSLVSVSVAGQTMSTTVGVNGTWSVTATALPAGVYDVVARVRDADRNGNAALQTLSVEVNPVTIGLGAAVTYSVLSGESVVNTGATTMSGDLGVSPGDSVTGFPPGTVDGSIHAGDSAAADAQEDLLTALDDASSRVLHTSITGDLGGQTFHVGVHRAAAALALTGTVTLDGEGDPGAVFIFQTDAAFNTAAASSVNLIGGAQASNVFWVVAGAAGTGANSFLSGTILARGAITLGASTALTGRALSRGPVTLAGDVITGTTPAPLAFRLATTAPDNLTELSPDDAVVPDPWRTDAPPPSAPPATEAPAEPDSDEEADIPTPTLTPTPMPTPDVSPLPTSSPPEVAS